MVWKFAKFWRGVSGSGQGQRSRILVLRGRTLGALAFAIGMLAGAPAAWGGTFKVYSPLVEQQELEIELRGAAQWNGGDWEGRSEDVVLGVGYGVTAYWFTEIYGGWNRPGMGGLVFEATEWENKIQFTEQGKYWLDLGLLVETEFNAAPNGPDKLEVVPLLQKDWGSTRNLLNLKFEQEFGTNAAPGTVFAYAWETRWFLSRAFDPGFDIFGEGEELRAGPMVAGKVRLPERLGFKYEVAYLAGLTSATPGNTFRFMMEVEF